MKEIVIDGVTYTLTPKEEVLVFGEYKIGSCVVSLENRSDIRKIGDVFKVLEKSNESELWFTEYIYNPDIESWRQATAEETAEYEKRGGTYNISELKPKFPKTWEELENISGWYIYGDGSIENIENSSPLMYTKNIFHTKEQAEASIALAQLSQLLKLYQGNWIPNWSNNIDKYCILGIEDSFGVFTSEHFPSFLSFPTYELAQEFLDNFRDLIAKAKPLL